MENTKTITIAVEDEKKISKTTLTNSGIACSVGEIKKKMRVKVFEGGQAPTYKNGNWMDTFVREAYVLPKDHVGKSFDMNDLMFEYYGKGKVTYEEGDVVVLKLGFALELLPNHELWLVPRSGTFRKTGLILTNSKGIGDDSFIGDNDEYSACMLATRESSFNIGDRLIQMRVAEAMGDKYSFEQVESFGNADRGAFGTTGK